MPSLLTHHAVSRRQFLRVGSSLLALPWLESLAGAAAATDSPRRLVAICNNFGFHGPAFFPTEAGENYKPSEYLELLGDLRKKFTVFSGISHPDIGGDHASESCFLTSAKRPTAPGFRNSVSLDFLASRHVAGATRFPLLSLSTVDGGLTYTSTGAGVPPLTTPSDIFTKMFVTGTPQQMQAEIERLKRGRSVLDRMEERFGDLGRTLSERDRQQVADYTEAVRELEKQVQSDEGWAARPKPTIDAKPPTDSKERGDIVGRSKLMFNIIKLALQTDSTRVISLAIRGQDIRPPIEGVSDELTETVGELEPPGVTLMVGVAVRVLVVEMVGVTDGADEGAAATIDDTSAAVRARPYSATSSSWPAKRSPLLTDILPFQATKRDASGARFRCQDCVTCSAPST